MTNQVESPAIWDGERRYTGTEDFENDFDPTAEPYTLPDRPHYVEDYHRLPNGRKHVAYSLPVTAGVATKILGEDPARDFFYINAATPNSVILGDQSSIAQGLGYIVAGAEKLSSNSEVWATAVAGTVIVSYWVESKA